MDVSDGWHGGRSARPAQFELMLSFMERHGDINKVSGLDAQGRLENLQKWIELAHLLNDKSLGQPKPLDKWKKCWSDFKNNTKKKENRIKRKQCRSSLTNLERRLLVLIDDSKNDKSKTSDDENPIMVKEEIEHCDRTSSPALQYFQDTGEGEGDSVDHEKRRRRKSTASSYSSTSSKSEETPGKRKKHFKDSAEDMTDKYLEFEREREKMAHEREMARIHQNDKFITIFGRIVNVIEGLTPSIQKYLNRDTNDDS